MARGCRRCSLGAESKADWKSSLATPLSQAWKNGRLCPGVQPPSSGDVARTWGRAGPLVGGLCAACPRPRRRGQPSAARGPWTSHTAHSALSPSFSAAGPARGAQPSPGRVHRDPPAPLSFQPPLPALPLAAEALPLARPLPPAAQQHRLPLAHHGGLGGLPGRGAEAGGRPRARGCWERRGLRGPAPAPGPSQGPRGPVARPVPETRLLGLPGLCQALPQVPPCASREGAAAGGRGPAAATTEVPESSQVRMEGCVCVCVCVCDGGVCVCDGGVCMCECV